MTRQILASRVILIATPDDEIAIVAQELARILPEGANLGLSCGNPGAIAALKPGEVVLDLGSGAGFDAFLAAKAVGPKAAHYDMLLKSVAAVADRVRATAPQS